MRVGVVVLVVLLAGCFTNSASDDSASSSTPTTPASAGPLQLAEVATGFAKPILPLPVPGSAGKLVVVEQGGLVQLVENGTIRGAPYLDIKARVQSSGSEQGLLGLAFHPNFTSNGVAILSYTRSGGTAGTSVISRFHSNANGTGLDPASEEVLLTLNQPFANHNGGHIVYGPDSYLYVGFGDGGLAGDPQNNGQNRGTLLGSILRIDVGPTGPYKVPASNPFVATAGTAPEVWSYGWRNPWRFHFDSQTNDLWIADVGQELYEEVNFEPAGTGGRNYGWKLYEGNHHYPSLANVVAPVPGYTFPVAEYTHNPHCSVTGGPVYRGSAIPSLFGATLYGDFCSGTIWRLDGPSGKPRILLESGGTVSSFGVDAAGEILVADYAAGRILTLRT